MRQRRIKWEPMTQAKQKELARETASKAFNVKYPNNYQVGQARKIVKQIVDEDPTKYLEFHEKFCRAKSDLIVTDAAELLNPQQSLFEMDEVKYG